MQPRCGQRLFQCRPIRSLARLYFRELGNNRPVSTIQVRRDRRALGINARPLRPCLLVETL